MMPKGVEKEKRFGKQTSGKTSLKKGGWRIRGLPGGKLMEGGKT